MKDAGLYAAYILHGDNSKSFNYHAAVDLMEAYVDYIESSSLNASK